MSYRFRLPIRARNWVLPLALIAGMAACSEDDDPVVVTPGDVDPVITSVEAIWVEEGWSGRDPVGSPAVQLFWELPDDWDGEAFRVYSRRSGGSDYFLVATVTSCANRVCTYTDTNVAAGDSYDYFVAAVDERTDEEVGESEAWDVAVPAAEQPAIPTSLVAFALDNGVFLRWDTTGAARYRVFLEGLGEDSVFFEIGAADGTGYLDTRAENGTLHTYRVAAVSENGYVSRRSESAAAIPRPDYHAELVFSHTDDPALSGFRFATTENENPIVAGTAAEAQWRLEESGSDLLIVPLGGTRVTPGVFTTDLSCGPGAEVDCEYVPTAPAAAEFGTAPVEVSAGNTYVFQVTAGSETHYGKIRVEGDAVDSSGRQVVVFDWAYQTVANEPSLNLSPLIR